MTNIYGYTSSTSVFKGNPINLHVNSDPASDVNIRIFKVGQAELVLHTDSALAGRNPTPANASEIGCNWPLFYILNVPTTWTSGLYRADLANSSDDSTSLYFIVKENDAGRVSPILFQFPSTTYQAYNGWGGKSLYPSDSPQRARMVSFNRPFDRLGGGEGYDLETIFIRWFDRNGIAVECCTSIDLHSDPTLLSHYKLLISPGHDEYWSKEMRDNVEKFIGNGGNVAFFSGNVCWWQIRFEDDNRTMVCYKNAIEDPLSGMDDSRVTVEWYSAPVNRPENSLTGVSFRNGAAKWIRPFRDNLIVKEYQVRFAQHWVFEGTGLNNNDHFGGSSNDLGLLGYFGYETDAAEYIEIDGIPRLTGRDGTPPTFIILATADLLDWLQAGKAGYATMGMYRNNGTVFTAATIGWAKGLEDNNNTIVHRITRNVINRLSDTYPSNTWEVIGTANNVSAMTAMNGKLFAATNDNVLWMREPVGQNINWERIGHANNVIAMASGDSVNSTLGGKIYAITSDNILWRREPVGQNINWESIGHLNNVIAIAATNGMLFAATNDNALWVTRPNSGNMSWWNIPNLTDANWERIGHANNITAMTALDGILYAVTGDNALWWRQPEDSDINWERLGQATDNIVALAAVGGKIFAATRDNVLWWRDAVRSS